MSAYIRCLSFGPTGAVRRAAMAISLIAAGFLCSCATSKPTRELRVSVADQKLALYENGEPVRVYKVSTSKFGVGDSPSSNCTPIGKMKVAKKIGYGLPPGMVFKSRKPTGEVLRPNAPGRDPIVTRILWLQGTESKTRNAYRRFIYIHGTPEESNIGRPASYGCIRMRSMDVIDLFNHVPEGMPVRVDKGRLPSGARHQPEYVYTPPPAPPASLKQYGPPRPAAKTATAMASTKRGKP
jgi:hypothetical protein